MVAILTSPQSVHHLLFTFLSSYLLLQSDVYGSIKFHLEFLWMGFPIIFRNLLFQTFTTNITWKWRHAILLEAYDVYDVDVMQIANLSKIFIFKLL